MELYEFKNNPARINSYRNAKGYAFVFNGLAYEVIVPRRTTKAQMAFIQSQNRFRTLELDTNYDGVLIIKDEQQPNENFITFTVRPIRWFDDERTVDSADGITVEKMPNSRVLDWYRLEFADNDCSVCHIKL